MTYRKPFRTALAALLVLVPLLASGEARAQGGTFDHSAWSRLLAAHVDAHGGVDYDAFARSREFAGYLASLRRADPARLEPGERMALWINAYNAGAIALINRHGERRSIRNVRRTLGILPGKGPWQEPVVVVAGRAYSLDGIVNGVLRTQFREPRIHFALVFAARGAPPLRREAYTGARLEAQLNDQGRIFLTRSPEKNRVDVGRRRVHLTRILDWYGYDVYGGAPESVGMWIAEFYPDGPERQLLRSGRFTIAFTPFDWSLNSKR